MGLSSEGTPIPRKPLSWIEPAKRGDAQAMERAMEPFRPFLTMIAGRLIEPVLAAKIDAADLVQETFLAAYQSIANFQGSTEAEWRAWLKVIMINRLANLRRSYLDTQKRGLDRTTPQGALDGSIGRSRNLNTTPSAFVRLKERDQALEHALGLLPEHHRAVVRWHYSDGLSFEAIGSRLGVSADAARKLWIRALGRLQKLLSPDYDPQ